MSNTGDTVESLLTGMEHYILEIRQKDEEISSLGRDNGQLRSDLDRLSQHYQGLMRECDEKDATIERLQKELDLRWEYIKNVPGAIVEACKAVTDENERLQVVLEAARNMFTKQYIAQHGEVVPGQPFRVMTFARSYIEALRKAVQDCAPEPAPESIKEMPELTPEQLAQQRRNPYFGLDRDA